MCSTHKAFVFLLKYNIQWLHTSLLSSDALFRYFTTRSPVTQHQVLLSSTSAQQSDTASGLKAAPTDLLTGHLFWLVHRGPVQIKKQLHISQKQRWESVNMTFVTES